MKRYVLFVMTLGLLITATTTTTLAADKPVENHKAIKVATFSNHKAYQEFQANIDLIHQQVALVEGLHARMNTCNKAERPALQKELTAATAKLAANNKKMKETYGYDVSRKYTLITNQAELFMFVSPEEYNKWEREQKKRNKVAKK